MQITKVAEGHLAFCWQEKQNLRFCSSISTETPLAPVLPFPKNKRFGIKKLLPQSVQNYYDSLVARYVARRLVYSQLEPIWKTRSTFKKQPFEVLLPKNKVFLEPYKARVHVFSSKPGKAGQVRSMYILATLFPVNAQDKSLHYQFKVRDAKFSKTGFSIIDESDNVRPWLMDAISKIPFIGKHFAGCPLPVDRSLSWHLLQQVLPLA